MVKSQPICSTWVHFRQVQTAINNQVTFKLLMLLHLQVCMWISQGQYLNWLLARLNYCYRNAGPHLPTFSPSLTPPSLNPPSLNPPSILPPPQTTFRRTKNKQWSSWSQSCTPSAPTPIATSSTLRAETSPRSWDHTHWAETSGIGPCPRPARTCTTTPWRHWMVGDHGRSMRPGFAAGRKVCGNSVCLTENDIFFRGSHQNKFAFLSSLKHLKWWMSFHLLVFSPPYAHTHTHIHSHSHY